MLAKLQRKLSFGCFCRWCDSILLFRALWLVHTQLFFWMLSSKNFRNNAISGHKQFANLWCCSWDKILQHHQLIEFCPSTVSAKQGKQRKILNKKDRYTSLIGGFAAHGHIQLAQEILKNRRVGCFVYRLSWQHIPRKRCWANLAVLCVCVCAKAIGVNMCITTLCATTKINNDHIRRAGIVKRTRSFFPFQAFILQRSQAVGQFYSAQLSFSDFYPKKNAVGPETEMSSFWCWLHKFNFHPTSPTSPPFLFILWFSSFFSRKVLQKKSSFLQFASLWTFSNTQSVKIFTGFSLDVFFIVQEWLDNMLQSSLEPNSFTFGAFLRGCEKLRDVEAAHAVLRKMQDVDVATKSSLGNQKNTNKVGRVLVEVWFLGNLMIFEVWSF